MKEKEKEEREETAEAIPEPSAELTPEEKLAEAEARIAELEKERLYRQAEFDNFRKNQLREKADLILNGGRKVLESMLPIIDDFELASQHAELDEGVSLIHKKLLQVMKSHGVEPIDTEGKPFDTDFHEAIAQIPAPTEEAKGKVIDCTKRGYTMNGKVLRWAQVVVGV